MIDYQTYCEIKTLHSHRHLSAPQIARRLSLHPQTVNKWLAKQRFKPRQQTRKPSLLDPYKDVIAREVLLGQTRADLIYRSIKAHGYRGKYTILADFLRQLRPPKVACQNLVLPMRWMLLVLQGTAGVASVFEEVGSAGAHEDVELLVQSVLNGPLKDRNRAVCALACIRGISVPDIAKFLMITAQTVRRYLSLYRSGGLKRLMGFRAGRTRKPDEPKYKEAVFRILHSPPSEYGINRTTWTLEALHRIMKQQGCSINKDSIHEIFRNAGFRFRKAKKVLTSNDPEYRTKLQEITKILRNLQPDERFFSVDEYGPFAVKMQGGRSLTGPGEMKSVPQYQKSKGSLILTAALELSENQVKHFYSEKKNTDEMLRLLEVLLEKYAEQDFIYFSWDAASWHASKKLYKRVEEINSAGYRAGHKVPFVKLAPLPSCAQFLNVIESVFSGMARAIIHNSDYPSVDACKAAIDRHFEERNQHFKAHPKRAGDKIWGKELVPAEFSESNNCKDPRYRGGPH